VFPFLRTRSFGQTKSSLQHAPGFSSLFYFPLPDAGRLMREREVPLAAEFFLSSGAGVEAFRAYWVAVVALLCVERVFFPAVPLSFFASAWATVRTMSFLPLRAWAVGRARSSWP